MKKKITILFALALTIIFSAHIYAQCLKGDCKNGQGSMKYPDGKVYTGQFAKGKPNGHGTMTKPDGSKYEGQWKDGKPEGQGAEGESKPQGKKKKGMSLKVGK